MREWEVFCDWCEAKSGELCKDNHGKILEDMIHRPRARLYDENHGLNYLDRQDLRGGFKKPLSPSALQGEEVR